MMSGEIDIAHGGAIAVDTELMRDLATRLRTVGERVDAAGMTSLRAAAVPTPTAFIGIRPGRDVGWDVSPLSVISTRLQAIADTLRETAAAVDRMCEVYELVELRARLRFASETEAAALTADIAELEAADPTTARMADWITAAWEQERFEGLHEQTAIGSPLLLWMLPLFTRAVMGTGVRNGLLQAGATLRPGSAGPVRITETSRTTTAHAPQSLGEAFERLPKDGPQLRVDRYRMPDGSDEFVLYATGTKGLVGSEQPWDMTSNVQMYLDGDESASYRATLDALAAAGAEPGATVHALGYSQGGMIVSFLASGGEYEVPTLITAGSPVAPTLGDETLVLQVRHTDDPVSALAGGGSPAGTGAPESIVAQRQHDPLPTPGDLVLTAHHLSGYVETAEMLDTAGDSRLRELDALWTRLGTATGVESTQYQAERDG